MDGYGYNLWLWGSFARVPGRTEIMEIQSLENADLGIKKSGVTSCP
jgi:hypothetical protein